MKKNSHQNFSPLKGLIVFVLAVSVRPTYAVEQEITCKDWNPKQWSIHLSGNAQGPLEALELGGCDLLIRDSGADGSKGADITFFGRKKVTSIRQLNTKEEVAVFEDGSTGRVMRRYPIPSLPLQLTPQDAWITEDNASRTVPSQGCYFGPLTNNLRLSKDKFALAHGTRAVAIFTVQKKAKKEVISNCMYEKDATLSVRIHSMQPTGAVPLADDGFLVVLENKLIVRFDKNLRTKANLSTAAAFMLEVPPDLMGSQSEKLLEMPIMKDIKIRCQSQASLCDPQTLHDHLLSKLIKSYKGRD